MAAPTFDTHAAVRELRSAGVEEPAAESIVGVVSDATSPLVTREALTMELAGLRAEFRSDMYRALWVQGASIVAIVGGIVGIAEVVN